MADHCDACGNKLPRQPKSKIKAAQTVAQRCAALLAKRGELEAQLREISKELLALGFVG